MPASYAFVKNRMTALSSCISRDNYARIYASISVAIAAVGREKAGWVDGTAGDSPADPWRGVSDWKTHYALVATGSGLPNAADLVGSRMTQLGNYLPLDVYARLYSDVSVMIAKCGGLGQCGPF